VFGVWGIASFELRAHGANRSLHSGNWGGIAPNPLWTLVQLLATMRDPEGRITVEGFADEVEPLGPAEREAWPGCRSTSRSSGPTWGWRRSTRRSTGASPSGWPSGRP
jgi:acetylornithine deacetylase/succinyl-diaminopimelate desuccinylase-like protein